MSNTNQDLMNLEAESAEKKSKNVGGRIFAIILAIVGIVALFIPFNFFNGQAAESVSIFKAFNLATTGDTTAQITNIAVYALVVLIIASIILNVLAIIKADKAVVFIRLASFLLALGFTAHFIIIWSATEWVADKAVDLLALVFAAVASVFYFVTSVKKVGGAAVMSTIQLLLSIVFTAFFVGSITTNTDAASAVFNDKPTSKTIVLILFALIALVLIIGAIRIQCKKCYVLDIVRYVIELLSVLVLCIVFIGKSNAILFYVLLAAAVSLVQIAIASLQIKYNKSKSEKEDASETNDSAVETYDVVPGQLRCEEYAEAYVYEGGPVAGVEMAEEVNPAFDSNETQPQQRFDPFMDTLTDDQRKAFSDLFIIRCEGAMPEIPEYVVGEFNNEFFRKIFIYLGQYREKIPNDLLEKIYQYSVKLS